MISIDKQKQIRLQPRFSGIFEDDGGFDRTLRLSSGTEVCNASSITINKTSEFEAYISEALGVHNTCMFENSADALRVGIKAALESAYGSTRRVFCPDLCPKEQADAIVEVGAVPVFIDVTNSDYNMDPDSLETAFDIFPDTKVVVVNHLYGFPAQIQLISDICKAHGAILVENATDSVGATYFGKDIGTFGDIGIRSHISMLDETIQRSKQIYEYYRENLNDDIMYVIEPSEGAELGYSRCFLTIESCVEPGSFYNIGSCTTKAGDDNGLKFDGRSHDYEDIHGATSPEEIYDALAAFGAEADFVYTPMNRLDEYKDYAFVTPDGLSVSETFFDESNSDYAYRCGILLPMDSSMTREAQDRIIDIVHACFNMQSVSGEAVHF